MKLHFLGVLQTHTLSNNPVVTTPNRYCNAPKYEVSKRCLRSLIRTYNFACEKLPNIEFKLKIFDDHSEPDHVIKLKEITKDAHFVVEWEDLTVRGLMPSMLACYDFGLLNGKDFIYFLQDDYLYFENCIFDMINAYMDLSINLKTSPGIYPYNDPYKYTPINHFVPLQLFQGRNQFWRTLNSSASCIMVHHYILKTHWDLFYKMATSEISSVMEDESINRIWTQRGHLLVAPMKSLALHMGYETEKDPFIDWKNLWDQFADQVYEKQKDQLTEYYNYL